MEVTRKRRAVRSISRLKADVRGTLHSPTRSHSLIHFLSRTQVLGISQVNLILLRNLFQGILAVEFGFAQLRPTSMHILELAILRLKQFRVLGIAVRRQRTIPIAAAPLEYPAVSSKLNL